MCVNYPFSCRIVIGAPKGTFPGGLSLSNVELPPANRTGLVFSCSLEGQDACVGVRGDTTLYIGGNVSPDTTNHIQPIGGDVSDFFTPAVSEGRLFDEARKYHLYKLFNVCE